MKKQRVGLISALLLWGLVGCASTRSVITCDGPDGPITVPVPREELINTGFGLRARDIAFGGRELLSGEVGLSMEVLEAIPQSPSTQEKEVLLYHAALAYCNKMLDRKQVARLLEELLTPAAQAGWPRLESATPAFGTMLEGGTEQELVLVFDREVDSCQIGGLSAVVEGNRASVTSRVPSGSAWRVTWEATGMTGLKSNGELGFAVKPEMVTNISGSFETTGDDKECGEVVLRVYTGTTLIFQKGYGHVGDGNCRPGDPNEGWGRGRVVPFKEVAGNPAAAENGVSATVSLEERNGEVNIIWEGRVKLVVSTTAGRSVQWDQARTFNTNGGDRKADTLALPLQAFP